MIHLTGDEGRTEDQPEHARKGIEDIDVAFGPVLPGLTVAHGEASD